MLPGSVAIFAERAGQDRFDHHPLFHETATFAMQVLAPKLLPLLLLRRPAGGPPLLLQQGQALLWQGLCKPHEDPKVENLAMTLILILTRISADQVQCLRRAYLLNGVHWR